jgi:hypothetical protein
MHFLITTPDVYSKNFKVGMEQEEMPIMQFRRSVNLIKFDKKKKQAETVNLLDDAPVKPKVTEEKD